jgi:hypothetical protein
VDEELLTNLAEDVEDLKTAVGTVLEGLEAAISLADAINGEVI